MQGSVGEFQRVVMGVSRVAGLSGEEGTANLIKLLQEYRETVASSEDFMGQLNKDTQAAGISTTKYLKIIDEVSSHFDRMSKSLEEVTGVMRELSRYGEVSSESLRDMMESFATAQDKPSLGNLSAAIYSQMVAPKQLTATAIGTERAVVQNAVDAANAEIGRAHLAGDQIDVLGPDMSEAIAAGDIDKAQRLVAEKRQEAMNIKDRARQQQVIDALGKVEDQLLHLSTIQGDAFERAGGQALYGADPAQLAHEAFANLNEVMGKAGATITDLMTGRLTGVQMAQIMQESAMLGIDPMKLRRMLLQEAQNRVREALTESPAGKKRDYRILVKEIADGLTRKQWLATLGRHGFEKYADDQNALAEQMVLHQEEAGKLLGENANIIAGSGDTQNQLLSKMHAEQASGIATQEDALDQAGDIGARTQTIEQILENVFKPIFNDMLLAVEIIAKWVSSLGGEDLDTERKQLQSDIQAIPDAIKSLEDKTKGLIEEEKKLVDSQGHVLPGSEKKFQELKDEIAANNKTIEDLRDTAVTGFTDDQEQLEKTIAENLPASAPGQTPGETPEQKFGDLFDMFNDPYSSTAPAPGPTSNQTIINNYYNANSTQNYTTPDSVSNSNETPRGGPVQPQPEYEYGDEGP
jgi:hypothetical protein